MKPYSVLPFPSITAYSFMPALLLLEELVNDRRKQTNKFCHRPENKTDQYVHDTWSSDETTKNRKMTLLDGKCYFNFSLRFKSVTERRSHSFIRRTESFSSFLIRTLEKVIQCDIHVLFGLIDMRTSPQHWQWCIKHGHRVCKLHDERRSTIQIHFLAVYCKPYRDTFGIYYRIETEACHKYHNKDHVDYSKE